MAQRCSSYQRALFTAVLLMLFPMGGCFVEPYNARFRSNGHGQAKLYPSSSLLQVSLNGNFNLFTKGQAQVKSWQESPRLYVERGTPVEDARRVTDIEEALMSAEAKNTTAQTVNCAKETASSLEGIDPSKGLDQSLAQLLLALVAVIWGTQHAAVKLLLETEAGLQAGASSVNLARFLIAAIVMLPWLPQDKSLTTEGCDQVVSVKDQWLAGLEMGWWMFLGFSFQTIGLTTTSASRSAFLLYLNVKIVPFLAVILLGRSIPWQAWASAVVAVVGTGLLINDSSPLVTGDAWSIAAATASAMFILRLEKYASIVQPLQLTSSSLWTVTTLSLMWCASQSVSFNSPVDLATSSSIQEATTVYSSLALTPDTGRGAASGLLDSFRALAGDTKATGLILYLGVIVTAMTNVVQTIGQQQVPAERAALIYATDPVYGALFAWLLLGEKLGPQGWIGALLILVAAVVGQKRDES
mmetsp:Transcript_6144/g.9309  ORF Transcript_6144/g.9309 Transcript_6144/m.9309 type:complete len:470 (-) Transcript_6144:75-1484(-)